MHKLEDFRMLITYIGNCIAFIRILRTASFNYLSRSLEFLPYIKEIQASYGDTSQVLEFKSETVKECCKDLDSFIDMMKDKFEDTQEKRDETDYLRVESSKRRSSPRDTKASSHQNYFPSSSTSTC